MCSTVVGAAFVLWAMAGCWGGDATGPAFENAPFQRTLVDFDECPALEERRITEWNITACEELDESEQSMIMDVLGAEFRYWDSTCWGIRNAVAGILQSGRGYRVTMDPGGIWWRNAGVDRLGWLHLNFQSHYWSVLRAVTVHEGWHALSGSDEEGPANYYATYCFTEGGVS